MYIPKVVKQIKNNKELIIDGKNLFLQLFFFEGEKKSFDRS